MTAAAPLKVLVVDDSAYARRTLSRALESIAGVDLVGTAPDGIAAIRDVKRLAPHLVLLDLEMPNLDGFGVLRALRELDPPPAVLVVSAASSPSNIVKALELGALDFIAKPSHEASPELARVGAELELRIAAVRAGVRVLRGSTFDGEPTGQLRPAAQVTAGARPATRVVVIGASTGGPGALLELAGALPPSFPAGIVIAQHMPPGFTEAFAERLARRGHLPAAEAKAGASILAGTITVAPGGHHLTLERGSDGVLRCVVIPAAGEPWVPSVDRLLASVTSLGADALAVVLTGMGSDGAAGALAVKAAGGRVIAESADTAVVHGMPGAVLAAGAAHGVARRDELPLILRGWAK